ncbi:putative repeat protein (TIGR03806 family) [Tahibacter aquaticus]|uniref:Putative repeat protein (TIGR03806 family) n=1 Tax=Tahibacter aquaticus TaxID=520092 RepID=A0A4R6YQ61_9GAMM|nr:SO2930 family diheme c-type cytochrome [Tahibacter aquaticus]TDR40041.1 putative repeat protein (TIGR03806 family) [Tahibacter aquaticus]
MSTWVWRAALAGLFLLAAGCQRSEPPVQFHADGLPQKLSDWHVLVNDGKSLSLNASVLPYDLNTPLFSDYAHKLRTLWMPPGKAAQYQATAAFDFPVGTIISKTFYYPLPAGQRWDGKRVLRSDPATSLLAGEKLDLSQVRLIETRLLVRREQGWIALPYVWNDDQSEAMLTRIGALIPLQLVDAQGQHEEVAYQVPDQNQCASCHNTDNLARVLQPIGPKARHLNRDFDYAAGTTNQLAHWTKAGYLHGAPEPAQAPRLADARDASAPLDARARAYLDVNCGHCHSAKGPANTSGLALDMATEPGIHFGFCKQPVAAGKGTGNRLYDIKPGDAAGSVLLYRMQSDDPAVMMPELGRSVAHQEGAKLIEDWINTQTGNCDI